MKGRGAHRHGVFWLTVFWAKCLLNPLTKLQGRSSVWCHLKLKESEPQNFRNHMGNAESSEKIHEHTLKTGKRGLVIKSICCSCKGPGFGSQHPHVTSSSRSLLGLPTLLTLTGVRHSDTEIHLFKKVVVNKNLHLAPSQMFCSYLFIEWDFACCMSQAGLQFTVCMDGPCTHGNSFFSMPWLEVCATKQAPLSSWMNKPEKLYFVLERV